MCPTRIVTINDLMQQIEKSEYKNKTNFKWLRQYSHINTLGALSEVLVQIAEKNFNMYLNIINTLLPTVDDIDELLIYYGAKKDNSCDKLFEVTYKNIKNIIQSFKQLAFKAYNKETLFKYYNTKDIFNIECVRYGQTFIPNSKKHDLYWLILII